MKYLIFPLFLFLSLSIVGKSQTTTRSLNFPSIGWKIDIPTGYNISDTLSNASTWNKEVKSPSGFRTFPNNLLFTLSGGMTGFINAYLIPFDSKKDGDWPTFIQRNKKTVFDGLQYDGIQVDSTSGEEVIAGNRFEKLTISRKMSEKVITKSIILNKQIDRYCLRIFLIYPDDAAREQLLTILRRSSFGKTE